MTWFFRAYGLYCFLFLTSNMIAGGHAIAAVVKHNGYDVIQVPAQKDAKGLTVSEPKEYHTGLRKGKSALQGAKTLDLTGDPACDNLPENFDLRTDVKPSPVSPVRNQGQCGSCWSFSETGAFETWLRTTGKGDFDLSEQELVSNDSANYGCGGGNLSAYQKDNGQGKEADFPYRAADVQRKTIPAVAQAPAWEVVAGSGSAKWKNAQCALVKYRTGAWITVGADNDWGSPPTGAGALWPDSRCTNNGTNHAILLIGYRTVNGRLYAVVKNSWGQWGDQGYATMPFGCDGLGEEIAFMPAAVVPPPPPPPPPPVKYTCTAKSGFIWTHSYTAVGDGEADATKAAFIDCKIQGGWFCRAVGCVKGAAQ